MRFVIACLSSKGSSCSVVAHEVVAGQFLSEHVAVKQVEGMTFQPRRSSSVTRPLQSKRLTFNLFDQEFPSHISAVAMSLYQIHDVV